MFTSCFNVKLHGFGRSFHWSSLGIRAFGEELARLVVMLKYTLALFALYLLCNTSVISSNINDIGCDVSRQMLRLLGWQLFCIGFYVLQQTRCPYVCEKNCTFFCCYWISLNDATLLLWLFRLIWAANILWTRIYSSSCCDRGGDTKERTQNTQKVLNHRK